ncbi:MAG: hypothetical protein C4326_07580 [Ignavibacteria bacterium]
MSDPELQYFYFGFYRVLRRYRTTSLVGWAIVLLGCLSIPFGWRLSRPSALVEIALTGLTILAGLVVVWQNLSALEQYLRVPFPVDASSTADGALSEIRELMNEVDEGGWQEAYAALGRLNELQQKFGLPKLE